jgi:hypothetical protein
VPATTLAHTIEAAVVPMPNIISRPSISTASPAAGSTPQPPTCRGPRYCHGPSTSTSSLCRCGGWLEVRTVIADHDVARRILEAIPRAARAPPSGEPTIAYEPAFVKAPFNHGIHLILDVVSCGAWVPIDLAIAHVLAGVDLEGRKKCRQQIGRRDRSLTITEFLHACREELLRIALAEHEPAVEAGQDDERRIVRIVVSAHSQVDLWRSAEIADAA